MIRVALLALIGCLALGCNKPDEASCKKAIDNMRRLMGTDNLSDNNKISGEVRRCKGGSSKKAVQCAIDAQTYEQLRACGFGKLPETLPTSGNGSGSAAMGSNAMGSNAMGSGAAMGSGSAMSGSGSDAMAGSGSAMAGSGSAMAGSGSATGSSAVGSGSAAGSGSATGAGSK